MPLPPALQARLQKRGILTKQEQKPVEVEEEVFAEDYDEPVKEGSTQPPPELPLETPVDDNKNEEEIRGPLIYDVLACPNRSNSFHECVDYCRERWGAKTFVPDPDMIRKRDRMLVKYPLPEAWEEVADPSTDRYYYWNTITDEVSWLSPIHPRAQITLSVEQLKAMTKESSREDAYNNNNKSDEEDEEEDMEVNESDSDLSSTSSESESEDEREEKRYGGNRRDRGSGSHRDRGSGRHNSRQQRRQKDELDPMDPASYSDIPRGGWSSGLDRRGEAKTGVDATASGPLFQQRPYPSPGEILRRNRENQGKS